MDYACPYFPQKSTRLEVWGFLCVFRPGDARTFQVHFLSQWVQSMSDQFSFDWLLWQELSI